MRGWLKYCAATLWVGGFLAVMAEPGSFDAGPTRAAATVVVAFIWPAALSFEVVKAAAWSRR